VPLSLDQVQHAFSEALVDGRTPAQLADVVAEGAERVVARLALYRRTMMGAWRQALATAYPVVHALIGLECFTDLARHYAMLHPSTNGDLHRFGARLAEVIAAYPATMALPYLSDVAALEWAVHRARHAADTPPVSRERIAGLSPAELLSSRFVMHPACWWMASAHPICSIWAAHQPDSAIELSSIVRKPEFAVVTRRRWHVAAVPVTRGDIVAFDTLKADADMDETISTALQADPTFDFARAFVRWLEYDLFVEFDYALAR